MEETPQGPDEAESPPRRAPQDDLAARASEVYNDVKPKVDEFVTRTKPKVEELVTRAKPKVEEAGKDAIRYVREHEDEIKRAASTVARYRLPIPLRVAFDSLRPDQNQTKPAAEIKCSDCEALNPHSAKFCNQCGSSLPEPG